ncbi:DUF6226 family protein [Brachybacterium hainanense]|uniref:DUF6226 family protein n=1 Tax=Brachybacterium hainanense TaxID=1541174 RepID=A0ABV6RG89_9MICO
MSARFTIPLFAEDPDDDVEPAPPELAAPLQRLLGDVETEFAHLGGNAMRWEDPHQLPDGTLRDVLDEEYSRVSDPEKYEVLAARAAAWARVLTGRGWAEAIEVDGPELSAWRAAPRVEPRDVTVMRPHRPGALALRLGRTAAESGIHGLVLGVGEPAVEVELLPDCGCDACDDGSDGLLRALDEVILDVVEGAYEVSWSRRGFVQRTPDGGSLAEGGLSRFPEPFRITALPWADAWTPRPLIDPL